MDIKKVLQQIDSIKNLDTLSTWEKDFIGGIAERAEKYGDDLHISDKQAAIIKAIWSKIFEERCEGKGKKSAGKSGGEKQDAAPSPFPTSDDLPI